MLFIEHCCYVLLYRQLFLAALRSICLRQIVNEIFKYFQFVIEYIASCEPRSVSVILEWLKPEGLPCCRDRKVF